MTRDGQGLELGDADAKAVEALDFLREEWLAFGKRFQPFMEAADREERCALLPTLAANLALSMNSAEGRALGEKYLARAKALEAKASPREKAWIAATSAWIAADEDKSLEIHEKMTAEWPRDMLAAKLGQLHAFNPDTATFDPVLGLKVRPTIEKSTTFSAVRPERLIARFAGKPGF